MSVPSTMSTKASVGKKPNNSVTCFCGEKIVFKVFDVPSEEPQQKQCPKCRRMVVERLQKTTPVVVERKQTPTPPLQKPVVVTPPPQPTISTTPTPIVPPQPQNGIVVVTSNSNEPLASFPIDLLKDTSLQFRVVIPSAADEQPQQTVVSSNQPKTTTNAKDHFITTNQGRIRASELPDDRDEKIDVWASLNDLYAMQRILGYPKPGLLHVLVTDEEWAVLDERRRAKYNKRVNKLQQAQQAQQSAASFIYKTVAEDDFAP